MQLVTYWRIIKRRGWIIAILLAVVLLSYSLATPASAPIYVTNMRFVVGLEPEPVSGDYYRYDRYYTWLTAEYLLDDLAEVVKSHMFARDVAQIAGIAVPAGAIQGATASGKLHRILSISITWHDPSELALIGDAVVKTLEQNGASYFAQLGTAQATIALIDPPQVAAIGPSLRQRLDLPLRLILALVASVAVTFLLDYLDDSVRGREDLQALGLGILAQVPSRRAAWWQIRRRGAP